MAGDNHGGLFQEHRIVGIHIPGGYGADITISDVGDDVILDKAKIGCIERIAPLFQPVDLHILVHELFDRNILLWCDLALGLANRRLKGAILFSKSDLCIPDQGFILRLEGFCLWCGLARDTISNLVTITPLSDRHSGLLMIAYGLSAACTADSPDIQALCTPLLTNLINSSLGIR